MSDFPEAAVEAVMEALRTDWFEFMPAEDKASLIIRSLEQRGWVHAPGEHPAEKENVRLKDQVTDLRRQLGHQAAAGAERNRDLDALHYVWCTGGCPGGMHRYTAETVTEDLVVRAERQAARMRSWWNTAQSRIARDGIGAEELRVKTEVGGAA